MTGERELAPDDTHLAHAAMRELRPGIASVEEFVTRVNGVQRNEGYRLVGSFAAGGGGADAVAVAGFRRLNTLAWGDIVYIDDLVTMEAHRGRGHARRLLDWILAEARRIGCGAVHLDSAPHRHAAHRLYLGEGYVISSFHFSRDT
ncbi:MAG TPA: GNAT family N-acetyltransferase [Acidimicrobiia bacterium]|nr:GNAT family N-acetyltransferase [Acidimicrobiia bacterium]